MKEFPLNKRFRIYFTPIIGGTLGGLSISSHFWMILMPLSLSILWGESGVNKYSNFLWGFAFIGISHYWLIYLHPLTWLGLSWFSSLVVAGLIWFICSFFGGVLVSLWGFIKNKLIVNQDFFQGVNWQLIIRVLFLCFLWGFGELKLAQSPFFWIGVGESILPGDLYLAGLASWFGSTGLCIFQLLLGFWICFIYKRWIYKLRFKNTLIVGLLIILSSHFIGAMLLISPSLANEYPVALWQTNIPTREKSKLNFETLHQKVITVQQKALNKDAKLLLMPEGTLMNGFMFKDGSLMPTLAGGFRTFNNNIRSSLLAFNKGEKYFSNFIDKNRLVPLGEKIPDFLTSFPQAQLSSIGGIQPGESSRYFDWEANPPFAIAICYEISDGIAIRKAIHKSAELIISLSNLDPYPKRIQNQFLSLAQMRSIENNRDQVIVSNTGPSALVRSDGNVEDLLSPNKEQMKIVYPKLISQKTLYSKYGDTPLIIIFILLMSATLYIFLKNYSTSQ